MRRVRLVAIVTAVPDAEGDADLSLTDDAEWEGEWRPILTVLLAVPTLERRQVTYGYPPGLWKVSAEPAEAISILEANAWAVVDTVEAGATPCFAMALLDMVEVTARMELNRLQRERRHFVLANQHALVASGLALLAAWAGWQGYTGSGPSVMFSVAGAFLGYGVCAAIYSAVYARRTVQVVRHRYDRLDRALKRAKAVRKATLDGGGRPRSA